MLSTLNFSRFIPIYSLSLRYKARQLHSLFIWSCEFENPEKKLLAKVLCLSATIDFKSNLYREKKSTRQPTKYKLNIHSRCQYLTWLSSGALKQITSIHFTANNWYQTSRMRQFVSAPCLSLALSPFLVIHQIASHRIEWKCSFLVIDYYAGMYFNVIETLLYQTETDSPEYFP